MRLCTSCNRILKDNDIVCPNCTDRYAEITETAKSVMPAPPTDQKSEAISDNTRMPGQTQEEAPEAAPQNNAAEPPDIMRIAATVRTTRQSGERAWDSSAARRAATNSFTIEIPLNQGILEASDPEEKGEVQEEAAKTSVTPEGGSGLEPQEQAVAEEAEDFDFKGEANKSDDTGAIERALEEDEIIEQVAAKKIGPGKLEITLILILAAAVVVFGVLIAIELFSADKQKNTEYDFEQFAGIWISDFFYFSDDDSQTEQILYCEQLIIRADGTFTRRYLVVDRNIPDGYLTGEWEIEEEISGTIKYFEDSRTLALIWEEEKTIFDRYIISLDDTYMKLREYYNEESSDFFDMAFIRVSSETTEEIYSQAE